MPQGMQRRRRRLGATHVLILASVLACVALSVRIAATESLRFAFLPWNLFLAWIPFVLAFGIERLAARVRPGTGILLVPTAVWALFLPNAPYIVTDAVHLRFSSARGLPFDTALLLLFALPALALGLLALRRMHRLVERRVGVAAGRVFVGVMVVLCGAGMWLGRVVRLNSWDVLSRPWDAAERTLSALGTPRGVVTAAVFSLAFAVLLLALYVAPRFARDER